ncbi:hypothetical protein PBY51_006556 [Eleginops maclovinus]|uniref:Adhesion G-protein coupled receptor G2-like n=1 Tax=Eleginops maclovinus TaxID=56733 RepID=A0AAN7X3M4_ELEMC|nr:hypothetical protein PBY51_006556 [Eleginops maclovinus]
MSWKSCFLLVGLLWIHPVSMGCKKKLQNCFEKNTERESKTYFVVGDSFNGFTKGKSNLNEDHCPVFRNISESNTTTKDHSILFLNISESITTTKDFGEKCPRMVKHEGSVLLQILKWHTNRKYHLYVLTGQRQCNTTIQITRECVYNHTGKGPCQVRCLQTNDICKKSKYNEVVCGQIITDEKVRNRYMINLTHSTSNCINCDYPVKKPERQTKWNNTVIEPDGIFEAAKAVDFMNQVAKYTTSLDEYSVEVSVTEDISGIIIKQPEPEDRDDVGIAYNSPNDRMNVLQELDALVTFSRSLSLPKEAFEMAAPFQKAPFVAFFRFNNLASDELNSTVYGNEVLGVDMGTNITNLTSPIRIRFQNLTYEGYPTCRSWNGEGSRPNWTDEGCKTVVKGNNTECLCTHLTFFALLLTPPNVTISSSHLNTLTTITQIGCGFSMFFLSIVLFMHCLMRKTKGSMSTRILICLVVAMFLLNFSFLVNNYVAKAGNTVGCKIMAALMHYSMLATFTWFAVQAFHLCLQLHVGGKVEIRHYILKVSIISWVLPAVVVTVVLILGKYGEQVIYTDNPDQNVAMCWITHTDVHYIVNIGYYALVFLFTFITFIVMMIPAYYIFTILNSFQGFFLFIYYYRTSHSGETTGGVSSNSTSSSSTLKSNLDIWENPYNNKPEKE